MLIVLTRLDFRPNPHSALRRAAFGLLFGAALLGADSHGGERFGWLDAATGLRCEIEASALSARSVTLTNAGAWPLADGSRIVWTTLGTPSPVGEARSLQGALAPGHSMRLATGQHASAAGCVARLID